MNILEIKDVVKQYSGHRALNEVSINVPKGKIYGLLGPNGAGKTTLIRIINQITAPDSGAVLFFGEKLNPTHISRIGYLPEERGLYKKMKVGEQAIYLAQLKGLSKNDAKVRLLEWFNKFGITQWWDKKVEELSKGMAQKVQFIVTVLHKPELLIFDEPFSGFDPINTELIKNEILSLKEQGSTIIFSTHNMSSVEELCDEISLINNSIVILSGSVKDIKKGYRTNIWNFEIESLISKEQLDKYLENFYFDFYIDDDFTSFKVNKPDYLSINELISKVMNLGNIKKIQEQIPKMNDIFIKKVEEDSIKK